MVSIPAVAETVFAEGPRVVSSDNRPIDNPEIRYKILNLKKVYVDLGNSTKFINLL